MSRAVRLFIEFEMLAHDASDFERSFNDVADIAKANGISLLYEVYRDPARPARVFAFEQHPDADSLARHFALAFPAIQKAWAYARPLRILILGDVPPELRAQMETSGAVIASSWLSN